MLDLPAGKTLIHCMAKYLMNAFYLLSAQKPVGWSQAQAEQFREKIWQGSNYPALKEFIARMTEKFVLEIEQGIFKIC